MGYMGFGMQKWIYSRNPKKPFEKRRISSFSSIKTYNRKFKIQPSKPIGRFFLVFSILLFGILFSIIYLKKDDFLIHANNINREKQEKLAQIETDAFNFLLKSGKYHLEINNIQGAYSEFNLTYKINQNNEELNQLLAQALSILCYNDTNYCSKLDAFLQKL